MYLFSEKKIIFCIILKTRDCITNDTAFKILHQHLEKLTNPLSIIVNQSRYGNTCRINIISFQLPESIKSSVWAVV